MNPDLLRERLRALRLYGLLNQDDSVLGEPWILRLIDIEENERARRSLKRRLDDARLGAFKPLADFDWDWPDKIDRPLIDELFTLEFLNETANAVLLGPNGIGRTSGLPYRFIAFFRNLSAALRSRFFVTNASSTSPS